MLFSVIALLSTMTRSHAMLGETEPQIEARYGKAVDVLESSIHSVTRKEYRNSDMDIIVSYNNSASIYERYSSISNGTLSQAEVDALLEINALGSKWNKFRGDAKSSGEVWKLENGNATAFNGSFGLIVIFTREYNKLLDDVSGREKRKKENALKGS